MGRSVTVQLAALALAPAVFGAAAEPELSQTVFVAVSYTHLRAHETPEHLVCRLLLEKKKNY